MPDALPGRPSSEARAESEGRWLEDGLLLLFGERVGASEARRWFVDSVDGEKR